MPKMTTMHPPTAHITRNKPRIPPLVICAGWSAFYPHRPRPRERQWMCCSFHLNRRTWPDHQCRHNSQDMPSQTSLLLHISKPAAAIGLGHYSTAHTPIAGHGPALDGLPTPPRPGCEPVPISKSRHVPDTAPIGPRLARVSKIYTIERLISVYNAAR